MTDLTEIAREMTIDDCYQQEMNKLRHELNDVLLKVLENYENENTSSLESEFNTLIERYEKIRTTP